LAQVAESKAPHSQKSSHERDIMPHEPSGMSHSAQSKLPAGQSGQSPLVLPTTLSPQPSLRHS
jgi:hypothetical protein